MGKNKFCIYSILKRINFDLDKFDEYCYLKRGGASIDVDSWKPFFSYSYEESKLLIEVNGINSSYKKKDLKKIVRKMITKDKLLSINFVEDLNGFFKIKISENLFLAVNMEGALMIKNIFTGHKYSISYGPDDSVIENH